MALIRVYAKMDSNHKIALPRGICKALEIKAGDKLELTIVGMHKARKLLVAKERCPSRLRQILGRSGRFATIQKPIANRRYKQ